MVFVFKFSVSLSVFQVHTIGPFLKTLVPEDSKYFHDCSVFLLRNKVFGKDHLVSNFINEAINSAYAVLYAE